MPRRLGSWRVKALLGLGVLALVANTSETFAFWTDDATVNGTTLSAGTIDLRVNGQDAISAYTSLDLTTMVPGSSTAAVLTVKNSGTASLKYTATTSASNEDNKGLGAALVVKVTGDPSVSGSAPSASCAGSALAGSGSGLNGTLVGTGRLLAAGATEPICVQISLPAAAPASLQGATTTVALTFTGTSDLA